MRTEGAIPCKFCDPMTSTPVLGAGTLDVRQQDTAGDVNRLQELLLHYAKAHPTEWAAALDKAVEDDELETLERQISGMSMGIHSPFTLIRDGLDEGTL